MLPDRSVSPAAFRWIVAGLSVAALSIAWPLWPALVLAAWTAMLTRPLMLRFERGFNGRRRAAVALSLLLILVLLMPLGLLTLGVYAGAHELSQVVAQTSSAKGALQAIAADSEGLQLPQWPATLPAAIALLQRYGLQGFSALRYVAGAAATALIALFIYVGGTYIFMLNGAAVWRWCKDHSPLAPNHLERFGAAFHETGRGLIVGIGLTSATQGLVATVIYLALGITRWWALGPITAVASMIPLVGAAIVWVPIMIGLFLTGHSVKGAILAVLGVAVISTVDNFLRPLYSRMGALKIPMFLLFVSIFGAIATFGTSGAILGPLIVRLWMEALALHREVQVSAARNVVPVPEQQ